MIRLEEWVDIVSRRAAGQSIKSIARELGVSRNTVRATLRREGPPRYERRPGPSKLDAHKDYLIARLADFPELSAKQLLAEIRAHGYAGGVSILKDFTRPYRVPRKGPVVRFETPPGQQAQCDFGELGIHEVCGTRTRIYLFVMVLGFSRYMYVEAVTDARSQTFLAGHVEAFAFFGGVFAELWYDNAKTAVVKILAGPAREEHERLSALRAHYLFGSSFCTPGRGNEKGSVENLVGYVRRNALVPYTRSFASFAALNEHLRAWCERERARHGEAWQIERVALQELPPHCFSPSVSRPVVVNKVSLVTVDRVRYSVPVACAGATLRAESFVSRVELYRGAERVAAHARSYVRGATVLELAHYLEAFARKPRAALSCAALASADPVFTRARDLALRSPDGHRSFAEILLLGREFGLERLAEALEASLAAGAPTSVQHVRQLALNAAHRLPPPVAVPAPFALALPAPDLACYDELAGCAL